MESPNRKLDLILLITIMISMCSSINICMAQNLPKDYLDAHNQARAEVGVPPLAWSDTVAAFARKYAKTRSKDCEMVNSEGSYGENLAAGSGEVSGADAMRMWLAEKKDYDHEQNKCTKGECGHYTQIIWKNTVNLGCASAKCDNGGTFLICCYDPPGNYLGEKPY